MASYSSDDLTPLFSGGGDGRAPLGYRQGVIKTWNAITAENTVQVDGATLTNLPVLNTSDALLLKAGDVVSIVTWGGSWAILGRLTIPGSAAAASALSMLGANIYADAVTTQSTTSSYGFVSLGGPSVTATVRQSGKVIMWYSAQIGWDHTGTDLAAGGYAAISIDGATPLEKHKVTSWVQILGSSGALVIQTASGMALVEGLSPGTHTFEMQYSVTSSGFPSVDFDDRSLVVLPV